MLYTIIYKHRYIRLDNGAILGVFHKTVRFKNKLEILV